MRKQFKVAPNQSDIHWHPEMPAFIARDVDEERIEYPSKFSDDCWLLYPGGGKSTISKRRISFATCESKVKDSIKRIVWCMLNVQAPIELLGRPNAARSRLTIGSVVSHYEVELRPFSKWMVQNGFSNINEIALPDLRRYGEEVSQSSLSRQFKARRLWGQTRIWLYAPYLPTEDQLIQPPWEKEGTQELLGPANWSAENKTIPIHPQTMSPLLDWAIRFVTEFSDDILSVIKEKHDLQKEYRVASRPGDQERFRRFLSDISEKRQGIPGVVGKFGNLSIPYQYLAVKAKVGKNSVNKKVIDSISTNIRLGCPLDTEISGKINGSPWIPFFDYYEVEHYRQLLIAACIVVIAYLSGMRCEECRALQRGCCEKIPLPDGSSRYEISGLSFKDALDENGNAIHGGAQREQPWHVIRPVYLAITVMEKIHSHELLFSESALNMLETPDLKLALQAGAIADRLERFICWCNETCSRLGTDALRIPEDTDGRITLSRFRRTLAWFIYRQPGGRISLGIQYGHLKGITSDGYGSRVSNSLRDVFPLEEAYAIADSLHEAADRLSQGEGVSGPSADKYVSGVLEFSGNYKGKYLTPRQASQLRRNPSMRIFDNGIQPVACCYDATKSLCHPDRTIKNGVESTPDLTRCDPGCPNVARTDKHIEEIRRNIQWHEEQANSDLTPMPLKERHKQRIDSLLEIIHTHETTKHTYKGN